MDTRGPEGVWGDQVNRDGYGRPQDGVPAPQCEAIDGMVRWWTPDKRATAVWLTNTQYGEMPKRSDLWHANTKSTQGECPRGALSMPDWYGDIESMDAASRLYVDGWKEGEARCREMADRIRRSIPPAIAIRPKRKWGPDGDDMDPMRIMSGDADVAFRTQSRRAMVGSPIITLLAPFGANCGMGQEQLFINGAQSVVLCDLLEEAGYRVELIGAMCLQSGHAYGQDPRDWERSANTFFVTLKSAHDVFRGDLMAATLAHAGTFRTLGFWTLNTSPAPAGSCLGRVTSVAENMQVATRYGLNPHFDAAIEFCYTEDGVIDRITKLLFALEAARGIRRG